MAGKADSVKTIFYALGANFAIFVSKLFAAFYTGSGSMMAEAVHSLADCGNQVLLLIGMKRARKPATPEFPLGFGKSIYFWSFLVAMLLFTVGGMFSLYEGIHKIQHPEPLRYAWLALSVLGFGVAAESFSMWGAVREINKVRNGRTFYRWFKESRQSELIVIFGEDLAALVGLFVAFIAVALTAFTGNPVFDASGSIAIGVLLIVIAVLVATEVKELLIGQSVDPQLRREIIVFLEEREEVTAVLNLITLQLGSDVMVAVKAKMKAYAGADFLIEGINRVEAALKKQFPEVRFCFFEPDNDD
jgi:cation diffusion facilitator family transporter